MTSKVIDVAVNEAKKSELRFRLGAVIFKQKEIISFGHNIKGYQDNKKNKFSLVLKKKLIFRKNMCAEKCAILNGVGRIKGASILIIRINRQENFAMAKPCETCMEFIKYVDIKNIYYSNEKGEIIHLKTNEV